MASIARVEHRMHLDSAYVLLPTSRRSPESPSYTRTLRWARGAVPHV